MPGVGTYVNVPGDGTRIRELCAWWQPGLSAGLFCMLLAACNPNENGYLHVTGQIEGTTVTAGSRIGGRVAEVLVHEGQAVNQGDVLIRLDAAESQAVLDAARARLAAAEAQLAKAEIGATAEQMRQAEAAAQGALEQYHMAEKGARAEEIRAAAATADAAQAQADAARKDYDRLSRLNEQGVIARRQFDQAQAALDAAEAQLRAARARQEMVASGLRDEEIAGAKALYDRAAAALDELRAGVRPEDIAAARAARDGAAADVARAEAVLKEMSVTAPIPGVVESLDLHPGDLVQPGPLVRLVNPEDLELSVYVGAVMLGCLRLGQEVELTTDAHGEEKFHGTIHFIAVEGEYTPRNLQTQEERVQQVFEIKIDLDSAGGKLRAGMAATALFPEPEAL